MQKSCSTKFSIFFLMFCSLQCLVLKGLVTIFKSIWQKFSTWHWVDFFKQNFSLFDFDVFNNINSLRLMIQEKGDSGEGYRGTLTTKSLIFQGLWPEMVAGCGTTRPILLSWPKDLNYLPMNMRNGDIVGALL